MRLRTPLTLALLGALLGFSGESRAATLKIATVVPEGSTWMKEMRGAASEIEQRTEGRVKLKFYPGGV